MLFELSTAWRLLKPSRLELPRTLISLLSFTVIAAITWLVLVFYSVTEGLEKKWVDQLVSFTGSARVIPKEEYFHSYDYVIDSQLAVSHFECTSLGYKIKNPQEPLSQLSTTDQQAVDLTAISELMHEQPADGIRSTATLYKLIQDSTPCEVFTCPVQVQVEGVRLRESSSQYSDRLPTINWSTTQNAHLIGYEFFHPKIKNIIQPITTTDWRMLWLSLASFDDLSVTQALSSYLDQFTLTQAAFITPLTPAYHLRVKTGKIPKKFYGLVNAQSLNIASSASSIYLISSQPNHLSLKKEVVDLTDLNISCFLSTQSFTIQKVDNPHFNPYHQQWLCRVDLQLNDSSEVQIEALIPSALIKPLGLKSNDLAPGIPMSMSFDTAASNHLTPNSLGEKQWVGLLAPAPLKALGLHLGCKINLERELITPLGTQKENVGAIITGFYDPGIFPLGARYLIAPFSLCQRLYNSYEEDPSANFWQLWPKNPNRWTNHFNEQIQKNSLKNWFVCQTYEDFEPSKELLLQLHSDRILLSLVAVIILIVACSSIASMLVLLVNERRKDVAILRALGISKRRLIQCFGLCGFLIGFMSAAFGSGLAWLTLYNIDSFMAILSHLHGQPLLNASFYGSQLPSQMSWYALKMVWIGSAGLSTLCGCLAAWQAAKLSPSDLLRSL